MLQANDINVVDELEEVVDYEDISELLQAVADGDCDGAGVPAAALEDLSVSDASKINVLDDEVETAYGVLVYPQIVPLSARIQIDDALMTLAADEANAEALQTLFNAMGMRPTDAIDFTSLREVLGRAGIDLAQMGS
jgi:ABC-type phosphate/phosphonate transport system substrate-binding protein